MPLGQVDKFQISAPFLGISSNENNTAQDGDTRYASYMYNLVSGDNGTCRLRYGTSLVNQLMSSDTILYRDVIHTATYVKDTESERILYITYLAQIPYIDFITDLTLTTAIEQNPDGSNNIVTNVAVALSAYTEEEKTFLLRRIFDDLYVFVVQSTISEGHYISKVSYDATTDILTFNINLPLEFFSQDEEGKYNFKLYYERAGIYKNSGDEITALKTDLDPNVIPVSLSYLGKLFIVNGVDDNYVYDGETLDIWQANAQVQALLGKFTSTELTKIVSFQTPARERAELETYLKQDTNITLIVNNIGQQVKQNAIIDAINFVDTADANIIEVQLTLKDSPPDNISNIIFKKTLPPFSFINTIHGRLWALPDGKSLKNQFRAGFRKMTAYYARNLKSYEDWLDETNELILIQFDSYLDRSDNLEIIVPFQGKILFIGRHTTIIYSGEQPPTLDDNGQNVELSGFKFERTLPLGILQKRMFLFKDDNFIFLSHSGIVALSTINEYQQIRSSYNIGLPISNFLNSQITTIETEKEYRDMCLFMYNQGNFLGVKIKYDCFICQFKETLIWTIFGENFADAKSFCFDPVTNKLYIGLDKGSLVSYSDNILERTYNEWNKGDLNWEIQYGLIKFNVSFCLERVYFTGRTLSPTEINFKFYTDFSTFNYKQKILKLQQYGALYNEARFNIDAYAYEKDKIPHAMLRFQAESIRLRMSGSAANQFIFKEITLTGGVNGS